MKNKIFALLFFASFAHADGRIELKGKIVSFDAKTIHIANKLHVFTVKRLSIKDSVLVVKNPKTGQEVDLWVPFEGITSIQDLKTTTK